MKCLSALLSYLSEPCTVAHLHLQTTKPNRNGSTEGTAPCYQRVPARCRGILGILRLTGVLLSMFQAADTSDGTRVLIDSQSACVLLFDSFGVAGYQIASAIRLLGREIVRRTVKAQRPDAWGLFFLKTAFIRNSY